MNRNRTLNRNNRRQLDTDPMILSTDTDNTGAVAGAPLGLTYGVDGIPNDWKETIARKQDVLALSRRFARVSREQWELDQ